MDLLGRGGRRWWEKGRVWGVNWDISSLVVFVFPTLICVIFSGTICENQCSSS